MSTVITVALVIILSVTSTSMAYRDGARNESCYGHEVDHRTFGVAAIATVCADPCTYTLDVVHRVGDENTAEPITTYKCGQTYLLNLNYTVNAFEGFLAQARDVSGIFNESSNIYGTFLDDSSYLYQSLMCGVNEGNTSQLFPNSATQKVPVNLEEYVPLYWRAPDPLSDIDQLPIGLTFWFTIVQQQQTFFFPIEGPTLVRDNVPCNLQTTTQPTTPEQTTTEETTPEEITPEEITPEEITPEEITPEETTPEEMAPGKTTSEETTVTVEETERSPEPTTSEPISCITERPEACSHSTGLIAGMAAVIVILVLLLFTSGVLNIVLFIRQRQILQHSNKNINQQESDEAVTWSNTEGVDIDTTTCEAYEVMKHKDQRGNRNEGGTQEAAAMYEEVGGGSQNRGRLSGQEATYEQI